LPLLSQGKCNQDLDDDYDQSSASRGIDIIIIDTKFNFEYEEFSNTEDRSAKCKAVIKNGKSEVEFNNDIRCENIQLQHGQYVANSVGGLNNGSAGLYSIAFPSDEFNSFKYSDLITGLRYIFENMIRPHKTVIDIIIGLNDKIS